jgi:hypothetical protein
MGDTVIVTEVLYMILLYRLSLFLLCGVVDYYHVVWLAVLLPLLSCATSIRTMWPISGSIICSSITMIDTSLYNIY